MRAISDTITAQARWAPGIRGTCPWGPTAFLQLALYVLTKTTFLLKNGDVWGLLRLVVFVF